MPDVSPDDLTARLRELFHAPKEDPDYCVESDAEWAVIDEAADRIDILTAEAEERSEWNLRITNDLGIAAARIDALSADVARLTAELAQTSDDQAVRYAQLLVRERDEALARVAEHAATIERLRDALAAIRGMATTAGLADPATQMQHIATHAPILQPGSNVCVCGDVHSEGSR